VRRLLRAVRLLAGDGRIPRPLRVLVGVGMLPLPGPLDEVALLAAAALLWLFHRRELREAWSASGVDPAGADTTGSDPDVTAADGASGS
jgi:hypothetical protein